VLVVVILGLVNLLSKLSRIIDKNLKILNRNRLEKHTSKLTPKVLITREHRHDASIDGLTKSLLVETSLGGSRCSRSRLDGSLSLLLLHLNLLLLHLNLLVVQTTALVGALVESTLVLGLAREHVGTLDIRIHAGREAEVHVRRSEHLLTAVHATHGGHHALLVTLRLEHSMTINLPLGESDVEGLAVENMAHDLLDGLRGSLRGGKVAETEALAGFVGVLHDDSTLDLTKVLEEVAEVLISDRVSKVTDVHVGLGSGLVVEVALVPLGGLTLVLLLSTVDVQLENGEAVLLELLLIFTLSHFTDEGVILPLEDLAVHGLLGLNGIGVVLKVDEAEAAALAILAHHDDGGSDLAKLREHLGKIISAEVLADVLDIHVGVGLVGVVGTKVLGDELLDNELVTKALELILVVLAGLESLVRVLDLVELHKAVAEAGAIILGNNLARGDCTEVGEDILQLDEGDVLVKGLDEEVTLIALTLRGVTTGPHDTAGLALECLAIEGVEGLLSVLGALEVDVGIAERALVLHVTADTDGQDGTTLLESVVDIRLTNILTEVTDIERTVRVNVGGGSNGSRLLSRHDSVE